MSLRAKLVLHILKRILNLEKPLTEIREDFVRIEKKQKKKSTTVLKRENVENISCLWIIPEESDINTILFMLHGGGYCLGLYTVGENHGIHVAETLKMTVLLIDYPLAPENAFPAAIMGVNRVYESVSQERQVIIWGESSGCGLALNLLVFLRKNSLEQPSCSILMTPFLDASFSGSNYESMKKKDPFWVSKPFIVADYYTENLNREDPMISPLFHDVSKLATIMIHTAEFDTLSDDGRRLYWKIKESGGEARLLNWKGMWHSFHMQDRLIPEAKKAMDECRHFIKESIER